MNALTIFENQLLPLKSRFSDVLPAEVKPDRLIRTVVMSAERNPKLLECDRQSLFNAAMSAAVLGLECDGVTGQAYIVPFKNKAQLIVGYKGYNTIAARAQITISGAVVREDDQFEFELGSEAYVRHRPMLDRVGRRIVAAWATATAIGRTPVVSVVGIEELLAVKARSPGAKMSDSPWNDPQIGFPAMCEKTAKRRLARSLPLTVMQYAARMEEAYEEQGLPSHIDSKRGVVIEAVAADNAPTSKDLVGGKDTDESDEVAKWDEALRIAALQGTNALSTAWIEVPKHLKQALKAALDRRHKPNAKEADDQNERGEKPL
jgi:recombination protein RecT